MELGIKKFLTKIHDVISLRRLIHQKNPLNYFGYTIYEWPKGQSSAFIWSLSNFHHIIRWWAKHIISPKNIIEIGIEHGISSNTIQTIAKQFNAKYIGVDPSINDKLKQRLEQNYQYTQVFIEESITVLKKLHKDGSLNTVNWFIIDGDHNYYTFYNELKIILSSLQENPRPFVILAHDFSWPNAFRDAYYNLRSIPKKFRQPIKDEGGFIKLHKSQLAEVGSLYSETLQKHLDQGYPIYANKEFGAKNGLLPAYFDINKEFEDLDLFLTIIPANFGLGIITSLRSLSLLRHLKLLYFIRALALFFPLISTLEYTRLKLLEEYNHKALRLNQCKDSRSVNK